MSKQLERKSTTNLLLDLVYHLEAQRSPVPSIANEAQVDQILTILETRSNEQFSGKPESCIDWFLGSSSTLSDHEKAKVIRMMELRSGRKEFSETFKEMIEEMKKKER